MARKSRKVDSLCGSRGLTRTTQKTRSPKTRPACHPSASAKLRFGAHKQASHSARVGKSPPLPFDSPRVELLLRGPKLDERSLQLSPGPSPQTGHAQPTFCMEQMCCWQYSWQSEGGIAAWRLYLRSEKRGSGKTLGTTAHFEPGTSKENPSFLETWLETRVPIACTGQSRSIRRSEPICWKLRITQFMSATF